MMVFITHNTDFGDAFEQEAADPQYFYTFSVEGYQMGINMLLYALLIEVTVQLRVQVLIPQSLYRTCPYRNLSLKNVSSYCVGVRAACSRSRSAARRASTSACWRFRWRGWSACTRAGRPTRCWPGFRPSLFVTLAGVTVLFTLAEDQRHRRCARAPAARHWRAGAMRWCLR